MPSAVQLQVKLILSPCAVAGEGAFCSRLMELTFYRSLRSPKITSGCFQLEHLT